MSVMPCIFLVLVVAVAAAAAAATAVAAGVILSSNTWINEDVKMHDDRLVISSSKVENR